MLAHGYGPSDSFASVSSRGEYGNFGLVYLAWRHGFPLLAKIFDKTSFDNANGAAGVAGLGQ
jgi:hypothetical protein